MKFHKFCCRLCRPNTICNIINNTVVTALYRCDIVLNHKHFTLSNLQCEHCKTGNLIAYSFRVKQQIVKYNKIKCTHIQKSINVIFICLDIFFFLMKTIFFNRNRKISIFYIESYQKTVFSKSSDIIFILCALYYDFHCELKRKYFYIPKFVNKINWYIKTKILI